MKFVVDRLHIQGHTGPIRLKGNHPVLFPESAGDNTVCDKVCEEINAYLAGFKYNVKHMNWVKNNFFFFWVVYYYNELKLSNSK